MTGISSWPISSLSINGGSPTESFSDHPLFFSEGFEDGLPGRSSGDVAGLHHVLRRQHPVDVRLNEGGKAPELFDGALAEGLSVLQAVQNHPPHHFVGLAAGKSIFYQIDRETGGIGKAGLRAIRHLPPVHLNRLQRRS